jgi:plastocyanin
MPMASVAIMFVTGAAPLSAGAVPATHEVVIEGMRFKPDSLTVHRGDRIVWRNKDIVPHTATAAGAFDSHTIPAGGSWTYVAGKRGTVPYVCTMHPTMQGTLAVQ